MKLILLSFQPNIVNVSPGASVDVRNVDGNMFGEPHSLTARNGSFDTGVFTSGTRTITAPTTPGRYPFICVIHPFMVGVMQVRGA